MHQPPTRCRHGRIADWGHWEPEEPIPPGCPDCDPRPDYVARLWRWLAGSEKPLP